MEIDSLTSFIVIHILFGCINHLNKDENKITPISYSNSIVLNTTRQLYIHIPVLLLSLNGHFNTGVYRYMVFDNCNKYPT